MDYMKSLLNQMDKAVEESKDNPEVGHDMADEILCKALIFLGHVELVEKYTSVKKWYA